MSFEFEELEDIIYQMKQKVYILNATEPERLEKLLKELGITWTSNSTDVGQDNSGNANPKGYILIAGDSQVKRNHLEGMIKEQFPQLKGRVRFALDYEALKNYKNPSKYEYAAMLLGPAPHKVAGMGDASSMIERLIENRDGYFPPAYKLSAQNSIRISKTNVEEKIRQLISEGIIS